MSERKGRPAVRRRSSGLTIGADSLSNILLLTLIEKMREDFRSKKIVRDRLWRTKIYKKCFLHSDVINWLVENVDLMEELPLFRDGLSNQSNSDTYPPSPIKKQSSLSLHSTSGENDDGEMEDRTEHSKFSRRLSGLSISGKSTCSSARCSDEEMAVRSANKLMDAGYIDHVVKEHCFRVGEKRKLFFEFHDNIIDKSLQENIANPSQSDCDSDSEKVTQEQEAKEWQSEMNGSMRNLSVSHNDEVTIFTIHTDHRQSSVNTHKSLNATIASKFGRILNLAAETRNELLKTGRIKDRRWHGILYKKCVPHSDIIKHLMKKNSCNIPDPEYDSDEDDSSYTSSLASLGNGYFQSEEEKAVWQANEILDAGYVDHVVKEHCFLVGEKRKLFFRFNDHLIDAYLKASVLYDNLPSVERLSTLAFEGGNDEQYHEHLNPTEQLLVVMATAEKMRDNFLEKRLIKDRRWKAKIYKNCFLHTDVINWLLEQSATNNQASESEDNQKNAVWKANKLIDAGYLSHVCGEHRFRIHESRTLFFSFDDLQLDADIVARNICLPPSESEEAVSDKLEGGSYEEIPTELILANTMRMELAEKGLISERRYRAQNYKDCFTHSDAISWLLEQNKNMPNTVSEQQREEEAVQQANEMLDAGYIGHILKEDRFRVGEHRTLLFRFYHVRIDADLEVWTPSTPDDEVNNETVLRMLTGNSSDEEEDESENDFDDDIPIRTITIIPTSVELALVAKTLSDQAWPLVHTSDDTLTMIDEVLAVLESRLVSVLISRKNPNASFSSQSSHILNLPDSVHAQLRLYVIRIAELYRQVPYHSFYHACHVLLSVNKMIDMLLDTKNNDAFGLKQDPFSLFAVVFAALVHDVGHLGLRNSQLIEDKNCLATIYHNESVAEKHSIVLAFNILKGSRFTSLRDLMFPSADEFGKFRLVVIDLVLCTDIASAGRREITKARWNKAFGANNDTKDKSKNKIHSNFLFGKLRASDNEKFERELKAQQHEIHMELALRGSNVAMFSSAKTSKEQLQRSVVLETLIHAADVAHNFQRWETFVDWNARLYKEDLEAFRAGKGEDPTANWFKGQIGFFDFYIQPLAIKLKECGVFGENDGIFLHGVEENRKKWLASGEALTSELVLQSKQS